ncbi:hypothetical protein CPC08DRAFT_727327 [Agrocybe pediades]|nr:hypothetical protein CPC08DRAFT_727327 [Agrocybe pediades]
MTALAPLSKKKKDHASTNEVELRQRAASTEDLPHARQEETIKSHMAGQSSTPDRTSHDGMELDGTFQKKANRDVRECLKKAKKGKTAEKTRQELRQPERRRQTT